MALFNMHLECFEIVTTQDLDERDLDVQTDKMCENRKFVQKVRKQIFFRLNTVIKG
jgi:hypothetical protein